MVQTISVSHPNGDYKYMDVSGGSNSFSVTVEKWKFCPSCGKKLEPEWSYCSGCGKPIGCLPWSSPWVIPSIPNWEPMKITWGDGNQQFFGVLNQTGRSQ